MNSNTIKSVIRPEGLQSLKRKEKKERYQKSYGKKSWLD